MYFCLKFKEWNTHCPPKCPYFIKNTNEANDKEKIKCYDLECLYLTHILNETGFSTFFCELFMLKDPNCQSCLLRKPYKTE